MEYIETNTLAEHIIAFLGSARSSRIYHRILREQRIARYKRQSVSNCLSTLKKKGLVTETNGKWNLTHAGRNLQGNHNPLDLIPSPFPQNTPKYTIVAFDIPEASRLKRVWLRNQLKIFGYKMVQQSLWQGPGPLPKEFSKRLLELGIKDRVKTFKIVASTKKS